MSRTRRKKTVRIVTPSDSFEEKRPLHLPSLQPVRSSPSFTEPKDEFSTRHRLASVMWGKTFDPFQLFEVSHRKCHIVHVHVVSGKDISRGWFSAMPDPYLVLWTPGSPNGRRRTRAITGTVKPVWNERFEFLLDAEHLGTLEVVLMDANRMMDRIVGRASLNLHGLPMDVKYSKDLYFDNGSRVLLRLLRKEDTDPDLRFSLALSDDEKAFLEQRRNVVYERMKKLLCGKGPRSVREVPCVAIISSGGGFRALTGCSGAFKALEKTGLLDCSMFTAALSGSSWYQAFLYCQPDFPKCGPSAFHSEIRDRVCTGWVHLLTIGGMFNYMSLVTEKSRKGQPVSFTDFFGHLVGDTLLADLSTKKLSEQRCALVNGQAPLPLYSCLSVKKDVSARVYQDWVEFSPYEVGLAKYGTFVTPELFGSKFYLGRVLRHFDEFPIHFLIGIWGSAFCILFKRLLNEESGPRRSLGTAMDDQQAKKALDKFLPGQESLPDQNNDTGTSEEDLPKRNSESEEDEDSKERREFFKKAEMMLRNKRSLEADENIRCKSELGIREYWKERRQNIRNEKNDKQRTFWYRALEGVFTSTFMDTRSGRAALIYNPLRGLDLRNTFPFSPFSPTTRKDTKDFQGLFEPVSAEAKRMYLVDAGLGFNLPFPLLLRPQRAVDVYLAFDYSARNADDAPPFDELLLAEQWAVLNNVPFPPVEQQSKRYVKEPVRECYVFQDADDPYCPAIIYFPLVNVRFRRYKSPGVKRHTPEEMEFGNFSVFSDDTGAYAMFNFQYTPLQFNRLASLVEFNVLDNLGTIKSVLSSAVARKRRLLPKLSEENMNMYSDHAMFINESIAELERYASFINKQHRESSSLNTIAENEDNNTKDIYDEMYASVPENVVEKPRKFSWARRRSALPRGSSASSKSSILKHSSTSSTTPLNESESIQPEKSLTGVLHPSQQKFKVKDAKELGHSSANGRSQTSASSKSSILKRSSTSSTTPLNESESIQPEKSLTGALHPSQQKIKVKDAKELGHSSANGRSQTSASSKSSILKHTPTSSTAPLNESESIQPEQSLTGALHPSQQNFKVKYAKELGHSSANGRLQTPSKSQNKISAPSEARPEREESSSTVVRKIFSHMLSQSEGSRSESREFS